MLDRQLMLPTDATDKLISQFNLGGTFADLERAGSTPLEVAAGITELVATTFSAVLPNSSEEFEYLAAWHRTLRSDCAMHYEQGRRESPALSKTELNESRDLQLLNGIRRGVRKAMIHKHREAERNRQVRVHHPLGI